MIKAPFGAFYKITPNENAINPQTAAKIKYLYI